MPGHASGRGALIAYVGCRTSREREGQGQGISVYAIDAATGIWTLRQLLTGIANPSFLAFDRQQRYLYAVHADLDAVSAFRIDPTTGALSPLNTQKCGGPNPVHLTVDTTNRFLVTANYANGTCGVLPIGADGRLGPLTCCVQLTGETGPHKIQQQGLYPHHIPYASGERFFVVPDKGGDQVCVFRFDAAAGRLIANDPAGIATRRGSGPRHIAFHPRRPFAYLANELNSTIQTFTWDGDTGTLTPLQILPSTPETYMGNNTTAEIEVAPSGTFVYISNRGHDSIAAFAIDQETGFLTAAGWQSTEGQRPRFFTLDPAGNGSMPPMRRAIPSSASMSIRRAGSLSRGA